MHISITLSSLGFLYPCLFFFGQVSLSSLSLSSYHLSIYLLTYLSIYLCIFFLSIIYLILLILLITSNLNEAEKKTTKILNCVIRNLHGLTKICSSYVFLQHNNTIPKFIDVYYNCKGMSGLIILFWVCCIQDAEDQLLVSLGMMISCRLVLIHKYHIKIDVANFPINCNQLWKGMMITV